MPALIAFRCSLIASNFQIDIIVLKPRTETRSYRSLRPQARPGSAPAEVFPSPLADTTSLVLLLRALLDASPPPVPGQDPAKPLSREDTRMCPQLSSSCQGGAAPPFIPVLPRESRGLLHVRESIILLDFKGCA